MSQAQNKHDDLAAALLETVGEMGARAASAFGHDAAGSAVRAITHAAAEAIRKRGVSTDQLVVSLRHVSPLDMPWGDKP